MSEERQEPQWETQYVKRHADALNHMDVNLYVEFNNYYKAWQFSAWDHYDEPCELRTPRTTYPTPELARQAADEWFPRWLAYYDDTSDPDMPDNWQPAPTTAYSTDDAEGKQVT